jgi:RNA polymerase sigma-70 factor (ECF subfamily)
MFFDEVYRKHYHELRRFGRQLNLSAKKCEDITQETFLKFYFEVKKEVIFENPRAWLYKVYLNQSKTLHNLRKHEIQNPESGLSFNEPSSDFQEEYSRNERHRIVFEMLDKLTDREKDLLLLYNNGLSYAEMADILEINPNSVGTTLVRAIERLKATLKIQYHEMFE